MEKWYKVLFSCHERRKLIYVRNGFCYEEDVKNEYSSNSVDVIDSS